MICVIALIVFAFLAVFSAKYRPLAKEAFECVFRRVTFRKCSSNLDHRLKSRITGTILRHSPRAGRFVFKYFEVFSWVFLILLLASLVQVGISTYNVIAYGNCYGPDESGFCIFDPLGANQGGGQASVCAVPNGTATKPLAAPSVLLLQGNPRTGDPDAAVSVIEFGCYSCPNTAVQQPAVEKLLDHYGREVQFIYVDFPLLTHAYAQEAAIAASCVYEQDQFAFWEYHETIFEHQDGLSPDALRKWALRLDLDAAAYDACIASPEAAAAVEKDVELGNAAGIFGTPTFFIEGEVLVGVHSYRDLKGAVEAGLEP
jgi:protein-disulfide isomerase